MPRERTGCERFGIGDMFREEIPELVDGARHPVSDVVVKAEGITPPAHQADG